MTLVQIAGYQQKSKVWTIKCDGHLTCTYDITPSPKTVGNAPLQMSLAGFAIILTTEGVGASFMQQMVPVGEVKSLDACRMY